MKGDSPIACYTKDGLEFADGSTLKADVIVFATGFDAVTGALKGSTENEQFFGQVNEPLGVLGA